MQAEQQSERERFEAWCKLDNPRYEPTDDSPLNRRDWKVWQAALSHPSPAQGWQCPKCGIERHGPLIACMQDGCPPPVVQGDKT